MVILKYYLDRRPSRKRSELHIILWIRDKIECFRVSTHEYIISDQWDIKKCRAKADAPGAVELNYMLDAWEAEFHAIRRIGKAKGDDINIKYFRERLSYVKNKGVNNVNQNKNGAKTYLMFDGNYYKIGKSVHPERRLNALRTANPNIKLVAYGTGIDERSLHIAYDNNKVAKEWFSLEEEDACAIMRLLKNEYQPLILS